MTSATATRPAAFHRALCTTPLLKAPPPPLLGGPLSASSLSDATADAPVGSSCSSLSSLETLYTTAPSRKRKAEAPPEAAAPRACNPAPVLAPGPARSPPQLFPDTQSDHPSNRPGKHLGAPRRSQDCEDNGHLLCSEGLEETGQATTPSAVSEGGNASTPASGISEGVAFSLSGAAVSVNYAATCADSVNVTPSLSGAFAYRQVSATSYIGLLAATYGFTPLTTSIGSAYFERLTARDPYLRAAALSQPECAQFVIPDASDPDPLSKPLGAGVLAFSTYKRWVTAVHLVCIYIAAKNIEFVPYKKLLQTMLSRLEGVPVPAQAAAALEMEVLQGLRWRLGPYFRPNASLAA